jgi:hypothetical protein
MVAKRTLVPTVFALLGGLILAPVSASVPLASAQAGTASLTPMGRTAGSATVVVPTQLMPDGGGGAAQLLGVAPAGSLGSLIHMT